MSYSSIPELNSSGAQSSYPGYYATVNRDQASPYATQTRRYDNGYHSQHAPNAYGWPRATQYADASQSQHTYAGPIWNERQNTSNVHDYAANNNLPQEQVNVINQNATARDDYSSQNIQGLNHLAYASGLESPMTSSNTGRALQTQSHEQQDLQQAMTNAQVRQPSPAHNPAHVVSNGVIQAPRSAYYGVHGHTSAADRNLATNAAAALANAVRERYTQTNTPVQSARTVQHPASPITKSVPSAAQSPVQGSEPCNNGAWANNQRMAPKHSNVSTSSTTHQHQTVAMNTNQVPQPVQAQGNSSSNPARQNARQDNVDNTALRKTSTNQQAIANIVNHTGDANPVHGGVELQSQSALPHYIDPSQVFNPYHREHERKKREATETEARRQADLHQPTKEQQKTSDNSAKKLDEVPIPANTKSKITKENPLVPPKQPTADAPQPAQVASGLSQDTMATEMQKMISRMKEFRNSDPSLFLKLWNDMKGSATATPGSATAAPLAVHAIPQVSASSPVLKKVPAPTSHTSSTRGGHQGNSPIAPPFRVPLNGYHVVVENNPEGLPDLGRFPAERRIRSSHLNKTETASMTAVNQPISVDNRLQDPPMSAQSPPKQPGPSAMAARSMTALSHPVDPGTVWPESRRHAVAIAAVNLLKSIAVNASIAITAQDISSILERNPSYLDLCTTLESRGLKFQRTAFARELLKKVPELQTPGSKAVAGAANQEIATIRSVAQIRSPSNPPIATAPISTVQAVPRVPAPQAPASQIAGTSEVSQPLSVPLQPAGTSTGQTSVKTESPSLAKPSFRTPKVRTTATSKPEPPVGSKEAAARKRDFAELIDLTEIGDNDNYVLPSKQPRLGPETNVQQPIQQLELPAPRDFGPMSSQPLRFNPQPYAYDHPGHPWPRHHEPAQPAVQLQVHLLQQQRRPQTSSKPRMILAKKVNKAEALQKSYYDPRTIARDILVACGMHPSMRPLNLHLAMMLDKQIEVDSDVGTFDWDAIDPGGPPPPKVDWVDIPAAPPKFLSGDKARKRAKRARFARTHDLEEEKRVRNPPTGTPAALQQQPSATSPSLSHHTLPSTGEKSEQSNRHPNGNKPVDNETRASPPTTRTISVTIPVHHSPNASGTSPSQVVSTSNPRTGIDTSSSAKRRGRPPGSKNKYPSVGAMRAQAEAYMKETSAVQLPELVVSYKCKWVKCHAELHNLETLKRHVLKKHLPDNTEVSFNGYLCWWKRCRFLEADSQGNMAPNHRFDSQDEWAQHIEQDHIQLVAMKYGDGPRTSHTGKQKPSRIDLSSFLYNPIVGPVARKSSHTDPQNVESARTRYLSDSKGRATTPLMSPDGNVDFPPDAMVLTKAYPKGPHTDREKADVTAQNAYLKAHGNKGRDPRRAAEEVVRAMTVRKQRIGPGLDRGGCTLINEARRSTFVQAPGISRVVDSEY